MDHSGGRGITMIGNAPVSTTDQKLDAPIHALRTAGCTVIFEEHASGVPREAGDEPKNNLSTQSCTLIPQLPTVVQYACRSSRNAVLV